MNDSTGSSSAEHQGHAPAVCAVMVMHVEEEEEAGPACGLPNKLPHAVILIAQQLLGAGAGRLGHPVVP